MKLSTIITTVEAIDTCHENKQITSYRVLARSVGVSHAAMAKRLKRLQAIEFIQIATPGNGYASNIIVTDKCRVFLHEQQHKHPETE